MRPILTTNGTNETAPDEDMFVFGWQFVLLLSRMMFGVGAYRVGVVVCGGAIVFASLVAACGEVLSLSDPEPDKGTDASTASPDAAGVADAPALQEGGDATVPSKFGCEGDVSCRVIFVTSKAVKGDFGGVGGADSECDKAAQTESRLGGKIFVAWISASTVHAAMHTTMAGAKRFARTDGETIANSAADLLNRDDTQRLLAPIDRDEHGLPQGAGEVWTGTTADGQSSSAGTCSDWANAGAQGTYGNSKWTDARWTNENTLNICSVERHLYCVEQ